ncbi:MAG: hypothetical protein EBU97_00335, partial [Rhodobacteraceae bacterium]|nr:hypothetical protein [Paracoccaceae bacterium]
MANRARISQVGGFISQEGGVFGQDAPARAEPHDLIGEFLHFGLVCFGGAIRAKATDLIRQIGDLAASPQPRHKGVAHAGGAGVDVDVVSRCIAEGLTGERDRAAGCGEVLPDDDELVPFEEVGEGGGHDLGDEVLLAIGDGV